MLRDRAMASQRWQWTNRGRRAAARPPPLKTSFAAGLLDKDPAHGFGRGREEMAATIPMGCSIAANQPRKCLVHQGRRLQRLAGTFLAKSLCRQAPQVVINKRQKLVRGVWVAGFSRCNNRRDVVRHLGIAR